MRVVFMGTPAFAVPTLEVLLAAQEVVAVYTRPDAASGRGRRINASAVKERALEAGVPVEQPASLRDPASIDTLRGYAPELIVVAAYGVILPRELVGLPSLGCVNVHASLLPRWRGAAPIQRAILAGDDHTGVSIMRMAEGLDTGPTCATDRTPVDGKDAAGLTEELARMGARLLAEKMSSIAAGTCAWEPQEESLATYATKVTAADVALEPRLTVEDAWRRVRASGPSAPCRALIDGRHVTVLAATPAPRAAAPGGVLVDGALHLGLSDGALRVDTLVPEGRSAMAATDWLRGARLATDPYWSAS